MSLLIASLAFHGERLAEAKLGVLTASVCASLSVGERVEVEGARVTIHVEPITPIGSPATEPSKMPSVIGDVKARPRNVVLMEAFGWASLSGRWRQT